MRSEGRPSARALLSEVGGFFTQALFFNLLLIFIDNSNRHEKYVAIAHLYFKFKVGLFFFHFKCNFWMFSMHWS